MAVNYKHLYYFWAVAKAGGVVRAAEQLHLTPQTLSGQLKQLEERLGCALLRKSGRGVVLTEAGQTAQHYAERIFALGAELEALLGPSATQAMPREFRVGIADAVHKAVVYRLLEPALDAPASLQGQPPLRLLCHEGPLQDLLAQLSVHRLDLVIADEAMGPHTSVKAFSHRLGATAMGFFAAPALAQRLAAPFPQCLDGAPLLVQGASAGIRQRLDRWLGQHGLHPRVVGEFDDAALMKAFGREGRGVFMAPLALAEETQAQYGVTLVGQTAELVEVFYAISVERQLRHPSALAITQAARRQFLQP